jgi:hypothetical protein
MKKLTAFAISIIISSALFANNFSFGVEGGAGINTAAVELSNGTKSDFDFIPTFRFGGGVEYSFNEVTSLQLKTFFHHGNGFSFTDSNGKTKVSFMTIDIPVLLKLTFSGINNINGRFSIFAGPNFSFRIGDFNESRGGWKNGANSFSSNDIFAAGIECGVEYAFTKAAGFRLGCSVLFDISDFSHNADFSTRRLCVMPYIGYWF